VAIEIAHAVKDALSVPVYAMPQIFHPFPEAFKAIEPYLSLAERMGKFAGQLVQGRIMR
jgi:hypothetical protein